MERVRIRTYRDRWSSYYWIRIGDKYTKMTSRSTNLSNLVGLILENNGCIDDNIQEKEVKLLKLGCELSRNHTLINEAYELYKNGQIDDAIAILEIKYFTKEFTLGK